MSRQQAVQQYVNNSSSASCSALRQTGCCTAVCVTAAGTFHPTFNMCLNGNTVHRPGVSKIPLQRSLSYSNECFLKNEAACIHAFQKYAPRKILVDLVMKREEDNSIIVVVTVEGVKAVDPGYKGRGHCYVPGYSPRGGKCTKLREKYAKKTPDKRISRNDRWAVGHCRKSRSTGTRIVWTISGCILALRELLLSAACVIKKGARFPKWLRQLL